VGCCDMALATLLMLTSDSILNNTWFGSS
jgi:hypothetical protein